MSNEEHATQESGNGRRMMMAGLVLVAGIGLANLYRVDKPDDAEPAEADRPMTASQLLAIEASAPAAYADTQLIAPRSGDPSLDHFGPQYGEQYAAFDPEAPIRHPDLPPGSLDHPTTVAPGPVYGGRR